MAVMLASASATGPTLAVLPLEKGAASEVYEGLGKALAGMLVTDLSTVEGLELVERERLSALMAEIKLAKTGFLDKRTAQRLGKGVGAQYLVTGSYSVVGKQFLMDARVVRVKSGKVVLAVDGQGTVDDFVAVEKELIEKLLPGIKVKLTFSVRRKLLTQAPTENFEAFSASGKGLEKQDQGKQAEARAAFEQALALDPKFAEAQAALAGMREIVETVKAEERAEKTAIVTAAHAAILKTYPSEMERKRSFQDNKRSLAGFALRLMVLENEEQHCKRYEEMFHYLERVRWRVREPPRGGTPGTFKTVVSKQAERHGFKRMSSDITKLRAPRQSPSNRVKIFKSTYDFIIDGQDRSPREVGSGLVGSLMQCFSPKKQLATLEKILRRVKRAGVDLLTQPGSYTHFALADALELVWCYVHVRELGPSRKVQKKTEALLARVSHDPKAKRAMLGSIERILREGEMRSQRQMQARKMHNLHQRRRLGQSPRTIERVMQGVVDRDRKVVRLDTPYCKNMVTEYTKNAKPWLRKLKKMQDKPDDLTHHIDTAGPYYGALRDMGCVKGEPARFNSIQDILAFFEGIDRYARPDKKDDENCIQSFETLQNLVTYTQNAVKQNPSIGPVFAAGHLITYHASLDYLGCINPPKPR